MSERVDVVVVGARCAGSPLAALLARRGLRVAVVERATFPRDTLSTHAFQAQALAFLGRLGVAEKIRATGTTIVSRVEFRQGELRFSTSFPQRPGDIGGCASVRRHLLDPILADAAADAGAELLMGAKVTDLVWEDGRVAGVRVVRDGAQSTITARLVVGADGRSSTVASIVGARKYNVTNNERFAYWSFFEGAQLGPDPAFVLHRWDQRFVVGLPADSGLYQVMVMPELHELPHYRADLENSYMEHTLSCEPVAETLAGAQRVGKVFGMLRWECYFREASGRGWVLLGDAGHFKDPCAGQGIQDAFRQAEALAPAIVRGLEGSDAALDRTLAEWGHWRDHDAVGHYWLANDMGKAGPAPALLVEVGRDLLAQGRIDELVDVFCHRRIPSGVFTPPRLAAGIGRLLARPGCDRPALLRELCPLVAENIRRQRLNRSPEYA
ncbi:MAG TPA: NAD(P)/FAD-dependent oxidoreductase [Solirubrobacteraceae bacterium]|nr:NAD(P)/FAD-dependent oxidoreductase [Solirubrobacteraceae bacterium]